MVIPTPKASISFDYSLHRPIFSSKLEEREYVKERLALAYRVLAHEGMCEWVEVRRLRVCSAERTAEWLSHIIEMSSFR
jgi:hypothetical protein